MSATPFPWPLAYRLYSDRSQVTDWLFSGINLAISLGREILLPRDWSRAGDALFLLAIAAVLLDTLTPARQWLRQIPGCFPPRMDGSAAGRRSKSAVPRAAVAVVLLAGAALFLCPPAAREALQGRGQALWAQAAQWWRGGSGEREPATGSETALAPEAMAAVELPKDEDEDEAPPASAPKTAVEEPLDLPTLMAQRRHLPPVVAITQPLAFPAIVQGRVAGRILLPAGTELKLTAVRGEKLVLEYHGATQPVAVEATDLLERVRARTAAAGAATSMPPASTASESSALPAAPNVTAAGALSATGEIPGLPPQPAAYFRNLPPR